MPFLLPLTSVRWRATSSSSGPKKGMRSPIRTGQDGVADFFGQTAAQAFAGHDAFAGALCLWLAGPSLVDVAPYINDARSLQLTLLGGGTGREDEGHDWEFILTQLNLLRQDIYISRWVLSAGRWLMSLSLLWAGSVLWVQFRRGRVELR